MSDNGEPGDGLRALLDRARNGCEHAATELVRRYSPCLLQVIRHHLGPQARSCLDPEDILQEVWALFFTLTLPTASFDSPAQLSAFLTRAAKYLALHANRDLGRQKRDRWRQVPLTQHHAVLVPDSRSALEHLESREVFQALLATLPADCQPIVHLRSEGLPLEDIATHLGVNIRTVSRRLARARTRARCQHDGGGNSPTPVDGPSPSDPCYR